METYGTEEARSVLGELVERVRVGGEHFVITRYGKPAAAIVPVEWLEAYVNTGSLSSGRTER